MIFNYLKELILNNFGLKPTTKQSEVMDELVRFILGDASESDGGGRSKWNGSIPTGMVHPTDVFILRGYAGTGKTSLIAALVKSMCQLERKCVLLAPTGRAAKVFSGYADHPAFTIHKRIYRQQSMDAQAVFTMDFNSMKNTLFVVDEASMISNEDGGSTYGTGRLLDDLVQFVFSGTNCRLLLMGDTAQLPPVGEMMSHALMDEVMTGYGLNVVSTTMDEVVRQESESGILFNATRIRAYIDQTLNGEFPTCHIQFSADVRNVPGSELVEEIASCYHNYGVDDTIVVCRSNKRAHVYNMGIRNQILDREEELASGDIVMIAKNNYYWKPSQPEHLTDIEQGENPTVPDMGFIANGDIARIIRIHNERELYGFRFADCELCFPDYDNTEIEATVLLDCLHTESPALTREQNELLFQRVLEDYADIPYKRERMKKMKEDPYYNALQIKYAYAVTCHKAQGGQWSQVFIDQGYVTEEMIGTEYYRWLYTAFTRATDRVWLVNWKNRDEG